MGTEGTARGECCFAIGRNHQIGPRYILPIYGKTLRRKNEEPHARLLFRAIRSFVVSRREPPTEGVELLWVPRRV